MSKDELETEDKIFEAACKVFQRKGYAGARMQEIADEADINRSMLHYYYRSKSKLYQEVYHKQFGQIFPKLFGVMASEAPLDQKIEQVIEVYYSFLDENPKIAQFIVIEMNQDPERFNDFVEQQNINPPEAFFNQINNAIDEGRMDKIAPEQLMVSIIGITLFPFIVSPMIKAVFNFDAQHFGEFLKNRKAFLVDFILNGINYKKQYP